MTEDLLEQNVPVWFQKVGYWPPRRRAGLSASSFALWLPRVPQGALRPRRPPLEKFVGPTQNRLWLETQMHR